jgi:hypothetical protein
MTTEFVIAQDLAVRFVTKVDTIAILFKLKLMAFKFLAFPIDHVTTIIAFKTTESE